VVGIRTKRPWLVAALTVAFVVTQAPARALPMGAGVAREAAATIIPPPPGPGADFLSTTYTHVARPGEIVTIQYQYRNSGTTSWIADGATQADLRACQQIAQSRSLFSINCGLPSMNPNWNTGWPTSSTYANQPTAVVSPGATASYTWQATVPVGTVPGSYQFIARLQTLGGAPLGPVLNQRILVPSGNLYTVNDVGDTSACDATTCTLRGAITRANDSVNSKGTDTIVFNVTGSQMINPASPLPDVIEGLVIDGTTQLGYVTFPPVWLNGTNAGATNGLTLRAASSIRGLVITHFSRWGIEAPSGGGGLITGNYVGTGPDGDSGAANGTANDSGTGGIRVLTPGYQIGTEALGDGNIVAANLGQGIEIGSNDAPTTTVLQNLVGVGRSGTNLPNGFNGILVLSPDALVQDNVSAYNLGSGLSIAADRGRYLDNVVRNNVGAGVLMSGNGHVFDTNTISSNGASGVFMGFPGSTTQGNQFLDNTVVNNTGSGFSLRGPATDPTEITDGNSIVRGSISNNTGEGILLGFGANGGIVPPTITDITIGRTLFVSGGASTNATVAVYADPTDEGLTFLGSTTASDGDGSWAISTWAYPDMAAIEAALRARAIKLHATQTTSAGTSQFSPTVLSAPLTGVAACLRDIGDGVIVTTTLPGTTVTLLSGSTVIATTQSDPEFATYQFTGLAPFAPLIVQYAGTDPDGVAHSCNVNVTTNGFGGGTVPEASPVINLGNHTWITAYPMASGSAVSDVIDSPFRRTFYKLPVKPQQIVTVQLTNLTRNYQLLGYSDIREAANRLIGSKGSLKAVRNLVGSGAVSAGDLDSGDLDSGDLDSGDLDSGDLDSGDLDSGDLDSGDLDSGDLDSGDLDSGDLDSGDLDSGDLDSGTVSVYQSAQRAALRYASGKAGTAPEGFTIHTRGYEGDLYFAVLGHNGVFDSSGVFEIMATAIPESTACNTAPLTTLPPSPIVGGFPSGKKTLILTNTAALGLTGQAKLDYLQQLNTFAGAPALNGFAVNGFVYDLDSNANVKTMLANIAASPNCVPQVNLATETIKALIWGPGSFQAANASTMEYVVFAGGDRAIPYRRITDLTFAGEINYSPPVEGVSGASLANNWYLTDSFYLAASPVERMGQLIWLNEVTGGRLVESAADIMKNINTYTAKGGVLTPTSSLVAGYQFNTDLVDQLQTGLQAGGASPVRLPDDIWGAADLRNQLLVPNAPHFDVIAPQAHFTATRLVPADNGQRVLSTEVASVTDTRFEGSVWLTIGCHSGYNIVDADATDFTIPVAFPEAILGKGGFLYGGTGYQFGDDEILANTELLLTNVMNEWRYRQDTSFSLYNLGQVPLGKALSNARSTYLNGLRSVRDIDRKVADVATFYGLPFYRVALSGGRLDRPHPTPIVTTPLGAAGLSFHDVVASFTLNPNIGGGGGTFFDAGTPLDVASIATRPILPRTVTNVSGVLGAAPTLPHGVVLRDAAYTTVANKPVLSIPVSEDSVPQPASFLNSHFSPWMFDLNVLGGDQLVFTPAQYLSNANGLAGQLRKYSSIGTRVYYSTRTDESALFGSPLVRGLTLTDVGGRVHVDVTLFTLGSSTVQAAMFTYTGTVAPLSTLWKTADLVGDAPVAVVGAGVTVGHLQHWHTVSGAGGTDIDPKNGVGSSTATVNDVFGVLQGVSETGDVVVDTNQMRLYNIALDQATAAAPKIPTALAFTTLPPSPITYGAAVAVAAQLTSPGISNMGGRRVIFRLGRTSVSAITAGDGSVSATVRVSVLPGSYQLQASFAEDDTALGSFTQAPLVVGMAVPAFVPSTGAATVQYSDNIGLALLRTSTGQLLRWQPIILTRTDLSLTDPARRVASFSDGTGTVRLDTMDFGGLGAGTYPIVATFPGDSLRFLLANSGTFTVTVQREGATIVSTPPPQQTGLVTVQGTLVQDGPPADRAPGDITRAGIHYVGTDALGGTFSGDAAVGADGTWSFTRTLGPSVYNVALTVTGNFFTSGITNVIVVAYDPTTFGTGGGYVLTNAATVPGGLGAGKKANFGFNVKYKDGTTIPTGSLLFQLKEANIDLKVTSFDWLIISADGAGKKADFQARATINGSGNYTVHVIARDLPSGDLFSIVVTDAANNVVVSVSGPVAGGSIKVH
jgi:parallel beta helix pectate lyase-like protein